MTWQRPHKFLEDHTSYGFPTYAAFERMRMIHDFPVKAQCSPATALNRI